MRAASSGTIASAKTCHPYFCAASFSAGPPRSSYFPAVARSETVRMPTLICMGQDIRRGEAVVIPSRSRRRGTSRAVNRFRVIPHVFRHARDGASRKRKLQLRGPSPSARLGMTTHSFVTAHHALRLFQQPNISKHHLLIHGLAHVVDREER